MTEPIAATPFFKKTYDDTLALVIEARNYMAYGDSHGDLPNDVRLLVSQESMRITTRLTQAMAWMLAQRAVLAGEMTIDEALSDRFALGAYEVCLDDQWLEDDRLPEAVHSLSQRSLDLFQRIERLESMLKSGHG